MLGPRENTVATQSPQSRIQLLGFDLIRHELLVSTDANRFYFTQMMLPSQPLWILGPGMLVLPH